MSSSSASSVRWKILALLVGFSFVSYLQRMNISVAAVFMMPELDLSEQQMGWVFSSFMIGYAACQIPAGWIGDRFGAWRILWGAAFFWGIFTILIPAGLPRPGGDHAGHHSLIDIGLHDRADAFQSCRRHAGVLGLGGGEPLAVHTRGDDEAKQNRHVIGGSFSSHQMSIAASTSGFNFGGVEAKEIPKNKSNETSSEIVPP